MKTLSDIVQELRAPFIMFTSAELLEMADVIEARAKETEELERHVEVINEVVKQAAATVRDSTIIILRQLRTIEAQERKIEKLEQAETVVIGAPDLISSLQAEVNQCFVKSIKSLLEERGDQK